MRQVILLAAFILGLIVGPEARAQATAWLQIEAQPNLGQAQERARAYTGAFSDVNGFALPSGWYAIVLGPFDSDIADAKLAELKRDRLVPKDAFVADGRNFRRQFWPLGAAAVPAAEPVEPAAAPSVEPVQTAAVEPAAAPAATIAAPVATEETPAEARRSEAELGRDDRMLLQTALQWAGFYDSGIDGAFGPGTRAAMAAWQTAQGYDATGILTTAQRAALLGAYRKEQAILGLRTVRDEEAGIEITLPTALIGDARYDPPFAHYDEKAGSGVRVLLISEPGDEAALSGLYDIMQTLSIVPINGERSLATRSFTLSGHNDTLSSYTYAALNDGLIKGYTLVWAPGTDTKRIGRVLEAMKASFRPIGAHALDPGLAPTPETQRRDLLSGLEVRKPTVARSGFYVDARGAVLTTTDVLRGCARLTVGDDHAAELAYRDDTLGLAVLKPREVLAPIAYAKFASTTPRIESEVAVAGFSYGGVLESPAMTFGALADVTGLQGETNLRRLSLKALPGDAGGPVLDAAGAVLGMLLPRVTDSDRKLPVDVSFAAGAPSIATVLTSAGVSAAMAEPSPGVMAPEDLSALGADMTVLVSCWK